MSKFIKLLEQCRKDLELEEIDPQDEQEEKILDDTEDKLRGEKIKLAKTELKQVQAKNKKATTNGSQL